MPEGVVDSGTVVDVGVRQRGRPPEPPPDPVRAPNGWTFDRPDKVWRPAKRRGRKGSASNVVENREPAEVSEPAEGGWQAERDPEPAHLGENNKPPQEQLEPAKVSPEVHDELFGLIGLIGTMVLPAVEKIDPHCGGALTASFGRIAEATVPLLCRSQRVVSWMTSASGLRLWIGLGIAVAPVAKAVVQHHVTKTVRIEETEQGPMAVQEDWSAYTAA